MITADKKEVLWEVIVFSLGVKKENVEENSRFVEDLGADSLDIAELMVNLEEKFGQKVSEEEVSRMKTVKDVMIFLEKAPKR